MAVKYSNAVRTARTLIGQPYSEIDCIRLIVMIIRRTPGGDPEYRCEGTNWLWRSIDNAKKYRHLTWKQDGIEGAKAGMLVFKRDGDDIHHVGFVTAEGTVIHSSSVQGRVVETLLDNSWHLLATHRDLMTDEEMIPIDTEDATNDADIGNLRAYTSLIRSDGMSIMLAGDWRVADD